MAEEVRKPVYWRVSAQAMNYEQVQGQMASVRWDIKDIMSQHNPYIDSMLKVNKIKERSAFFNKLNIKFIKSNIVNSFYLLIATGKLNSLQIKSG